MTIRMTNQERINHAEELLAYYTADKYMERKHWKVINFLRTIKNPKWVYVTYKKSIQGVDDFRTLTIRDYQNKVLYKVETRNIPADQVYSVLTDM